ncbi:hypothetical protein EXU85_28145 [Spirosoma sp. KCTC 42546]|uniref:hypothetical protein n=1 Tax=Spirosoma sp. KCTC 42546 TaxID=2520506 RepID=UPI001156FCDF|nr:hypothetical protein [Spirosoma sp. KCTC 42546]QDK82274.1 hypothetical protein EXU85_28145 [Spirosoma sp. KCTC 42546]
MKNVLIILGLLVGTGLYQTSQAQVNVNVNIGSQPIWGPTGYDYVNYYYLPDLDIYYYVPLQQWIYNSGGRWITTTVLPPQYNNYDLYRMHKVVINDKQPYLRNAVYRNQYASFKGRYDQQPIRDSRDSKYYVINNHPMHNQMGKQGGNGRPGGNPGQQPGRPNGQQQRAQNNKPQDRNGRAQGEHRGPR